MSLLCVLLINWPKEETILIKHLCVLEIDVLLLYIDPARFNINLLREGGSDVIYVSRVRPDIFRDLNMLIKLPNDVLLVYGVLEPWVSRLLVILLPAMYITYRELCLESERCIPRCTTLSSETGF